MPFNVIVFHAPHPAGATTSKAAQLSGIRHQTLAGTKQYALVAQVAAIRHKRAGKPVPSDVYNPVAAFFFGLIQGAINPAQRTLVIRVSVVQGHTNTGGDTHAFAIHNPEGLRMNT